MLRSTVLIAACLLAGCVALSERAALREMQQAQADHQHCTAKGLEYPSAQYTRCRLRLADARQRDAWLELRLVEQSREIQAPEIYHDPQQAYRPIREEEFDCVQRSYKDQTYIDCRQK